MSNNNSVSKINNVQDNNIEGGSLDGDSNLTPLWANFNSDKNKDLMNLDFRSDSNSDSGEWSESDTDIKIQSNNIQGLPSLPPVSISVNEMEPFSLGGTPTSIGLNEFSDVLYSELRNINHGNGIGDSIGIGDREKTPSFSRKSRSSSDGLSPKNFYGKVDEKVDKKVDEKIDDKDRANLGIGDEKMVKIMENLFVCVERMSNKLVELDITDTTNLITNDVNIINNRMNYIVQRISDIKNVYGTIRYYRNELNKSRKAETETETEAETEIETEAVKKSTEIMSDVYTLKIVLGEGMSDAIREKYLAAVEKRNSLVDKYVSGVINGDNEILCQPDAGFDLFVPEDLDMHNGKTNAINYNVKCCMLFRGKPCAYYLYARSSTGSKTPLRLANNVGIIDAGYRGNCISVFDNIRDELYKVSAGDRLVQLCSPNMVYPVRVEIVDDVSKLGATERNDGGFGSTGR